MTAYFALTLAANDVFPCMARLEDADQRGVAAGAVH